MAKPILAITMGDPAGVGPELCLHGLRDSALAEFCHPVVIGNAAILDRVAEATGQQLPETNRLTSGQFTNRSNITGPTVIDLPIKSSSHVEAGVISEATGQVSFDSIKCAIELALDHRVDGIVTCPIHKEAFSAAGAPYPGHTEMLAELTGCERYCMMLTSDEISCSLVTCHVGLMDVPGRLTPERILEVIELTNTAMCRQFGRTARLAVCGLNPHAGENGLFGNREEERLIAPAVAQARSQGIEVEGPLPPDTAFVPSRREKTDAYICMYHDQGLIPLKALSFDSAINVTLGLPIVRSSVDHGTALDIAWQGQVQLTSFEFAVRWASKQASDGADCFER